MECPLLMLWTALHAAASLSWSKSWRLAMEAVATIGLDIAKSVFQVHGVDAVGAVVVRRRLTRGKVLPFFEKLPPCLVGLEACATAHYWGRELRKLGHEVRSMGGHVSVAGNAIDSPMRASTKSGGSVP
jgi:hypothetical protein